MQNELFKIKFKLWSQLKEDTNPLVRAEAEYHYQIGKWSMESHRLTRAERRKQRKILEQKYAPLLRFSRIKIGFTNDLYDRNTESYTVQEVEEFAKRLLSDCQKEVRERQK